jgi:hypothetical protein
MFGLYRILVYSGCGLDRFNCMLKNFGQKFIAIIQNSSNVKVQVK